MPAKIIPVIHTTLTHRGDGRKTVYRIVEQWWSLEGELLWEKDPCKDNDKVGYEIAK